MEVTILVATFGDRSWIELANTRALPSARRLGAPVIHVHGDTLHQARNEAVDQAETEWVIHLDADDELDARYLTAMAAGTADLRAPAVSYIRNGARRAPRMPRVAGHGHACTAGCLLHGNWLVVGTAVRRALVQHVGGWRDFPWSEDWDLWVRCWQAGATIQAHPAAIYQAHVRPDSRNRAPDRAFKLQAHQDIYRANFGQEAA